MRLLLARHGPTFEKGQTPFYVGARTDLPLTAEGRDRARALARALEASHAFPAIVACGPLKRTLRHAQIVCEALSLPAPLVDPRLTELDYGTWEGKTHAEVDAMNGGPAAREAWDKKRRRPAGAGFSPDEARLERDVSSLVAELSARAPGRALALLVSSNGLLGAFLKSVPGAYERALEAEALKTAPGRCGGIVLDGERREAVFWNQKPETMDLRLLL